MESSLGTTIRAWRDRLSPAAAGLPERNGRRAAGLRREELAELAGISVDYVVRIEQGRSTTPSAQVIAALARALQLGDAERDHLYRLAGLAVPTATEIPDHLPPGLSRLVDRLGETVAAAVFAADWQLLWWNRGWAGLLGDPSTKPIKLRNFARDTFPVAGGEPALAHWPVVVERQDLVEAAVVSDLRRASGRFPDSHRLAVLVEELAEGNERFAELWAGGEVGAHREAHKVIEHPAVGPIEVDCDVMTEGDAERKVVVLTAVPGSEDDSKLRLAVVAGVPDPIPSS